MEQFMEELEIMEEVNEWEQYDDGIDYGRYKVYVDENGDLEEYEY